MLPQQIRNDIQKLKEQIFTECLTLQRDNWNCMIDEGFVLNGVSDDDYPNSLTIIVIKEGELVIVLSQLIEVKIESMIKLYKHIYNSNSHTKPQI
jgi:hypothetical protein